VDRLPARRFDLRANFARALKLWRKRHDLPLKKVAADLGFAISTIQAWESGKRFPNRDNLELIIHYTGLAPCQLFCERNDHCVPAQCVFVVRPA